MNRTLYAITMMLSVSSMAGCMNGDSSDIGSTAQSIVPTVTTTCASGGLEGDVLPTALTSAPWSLTEGASSSCTIDAGQLIVARSGASAMTYTRIEPRTVGATQMTVDVDVAIRPDALSTDSACPSEPLGNVGIGVTDGTRTANLVIGRTRVGGIETSYVALRSPGRCASTIAVAPLQLNIVEHHVYSLRLSRTGALVYIDKQPEAVLNVPYEQLGVASVMGGAHYAFRTERAIATYNFLHFSACGMSATTPPPPVTSACGAAPCPGNRPPSCARAATAPTELWPPNHSYRPVRVVGLTDADGDDVSYAIDYVTSDEPMDSEVGHEDFDQAEDGSPYVPGRGQTHGYPVSLPAERDGRRNGRVYALHVTANDGRGGTCETTLRVCVPHDHSGDACVDDGQTYVAPNPPPPPPPPPPVVPVAPGTLRCPAASSALAGSPVSLTATGVGTGAIVNWSVTTAPSFTRAYRFASVYNDGDTAAMVATGATTPFTSVIVGDFTVHAEAVYPNGTVDQCDTTVAMLAHGLRVELSWNTRNTDVDLHALNAPTDSWFTTQDCFYANRTPDSSLGAANRRWLDTDDVDGEGPENIRVDTPVVGRDYQVGVHYYSSHGLHGATRATVVIYCGTQRMGSYSQDLTGDRSSVYANDFWNVASVRFSTAGTCAVTTLGRVTTANVVRSGG